MYLWWNKIKVETEVKQKKYELSLFFLIAWKDSFFYKKALVLGFS